MRRLRLVAFSLALSCGGPELGEDVAALDADARDPLVHLKVIASPEMDGRATPSPGLARAIAYVVGECAHAGVPGALGGGAYEQPFTVAGARTSNVVARRAGSGPHADEIVLFAAHLDHLGHGFPGADDDGSGSAALVALAHRFARRPTDRSVVFLWTTGEERGLLGSSYFVEHPPFPLAKIVQVLNLDAIGALDETRFSLLPDDSARSRASAELLETASRELEPPFTRVNQDLGAYTRRTDAWSFVKKGVPAIWVSEGLTRETGGGSLMPRYHRATDTVENLVAENGGRKLQRMTELLERAAAKLAD